MADRKKRAERQKLEKSRRFDDLTVVRGVGEALERWFRESFDVSSVADLAALSSSQIERRARSEGRPVSKDKIREILVNAAEIAMQQNGGDLIRKPSHRVSARSSRSRTIENPSDSLRATFELLFRRNSAGNHRHSGGAPTQTQVRHVETGEAQSWPGTPVDDVARWIDARLRASLLRDSDAASEGPVQSSFGGSANRAAASGGASIRSVCTVQPPDTGIPVQVIDESESRVAFLKADMPYVVDVELSATATRQCRSSQQMIHPVIGVSLRDVTSGKCLQSEGNASFIADVAHGDRLRVRRVVPGIGEGTYRMQVSIIIDGGSASVRESRTLPLVQVVRH